METLRKIYCTAFRAFGRLDGKKKKRGEISQIPRFSFPLPSSVGAARNSTSVHTPLSVVLRFFAPLTMTVTRVIAIHPATARPSIIHRTTTSCRP